MKKIIVRNSNADPNTNANILIQNKIDYEPKVSVIIPVYNTEQYLRQCLDSVTQQTLKEIEIICVNDGSTDNSLKILQEYAARDNRITIISQKHLHAGVARNAGMMVARGKWIHFLDSDDFVSTDTYDKLIKLTDENQADFIKFCSYSFDNNTQTVVPSYFTDIGSLPPDKFGTFLTLSQDYDTLVNISDSPWSGLYKRSFLQKNNIKFDNLLCANDVSFFFRCLAAADRIYFAPRKHRFVYYRINNSSSLVGIRAYNFNCQIELVHRNANIVKDKNVQSVIRRHLINCVFYRYKMYINNPLLEISTRKKIFNQMLDFIKDIKADEIEDDYKNIYNTITKQACISIIIPVYNAEKYLSQCLNSIINQTLFNIEILCINDASTDGSLKILQEYAKKDNRIKVINNKINSGAPGAVKNIGIKNATGIYIGFVDSDDWVDQNYFAELYNIAETNNADVASTLKITRFDSKHEWTNVYNVHEKQLLTTIWDKTPLIQYGGANWLKIIKNEFIRKNKLKCWTKRCIAEDNYLSMISMLLANKIAVTDKVAYHYRKDVDTSITGHVRTNKDFNVFDVYMAIDEYIQNLSISLADKDDMLMAMNVRKIQDFTWFKTDVDKKYLDDFKSKLQKKYPDVYFNIFNKNGLIVSLTSYPARIGTVNQTIESLLNQTMRVDKVILWLAPEQFPNREKDLPKELLALRDKGLTIDWYHDIKSYKKLIPTLRKYPDAVIITTDDDCLYDSCTIENLYNSYLQKPNYIHCNRAHKIRIENGKIAPYKTWKWFDKITNKTPSFSMFFTGIGGVLYPPHCLNSNVLNESEFMLLCPRGDDIWFWANAVLKGTKIKYIDKSIQPKNIEGTQETALWLLNLNGGENDKQIKAVIDKYPQILTILFTKNIYNLWRNRVIKPLLKFNKHIKQVIYSHSKRGMMDRLNKNIADIDTKITEMKTDMGRKIGNLIAQLEVSRGLYRYDRQTEWAIKHGMTEITNAPNFEQRYLNLIKDMPFESKATITNIIVRLQMIKDGKHHDLFNAQEKLLLKQVSDFEKSVLKISDDKFWCNDYLLPINHFEASVFFYKHGLDTLENLKYFQNKAILDIGAYIGDSALILSPLTKNKVYCFEGSQENYNNMLKTIEMNNLKNVVPVKSACGDFNGEIELFYSGSATASDKSMVPESTQSEKVKIMPVDDYVREHKIKVGLIKVDIEGAEQSFLRGAKETICTQKPTLLISIYHNVDDFLDIKPMIESWNLGYKFKIFKPTIGSVSAETLLICEQ